ncbi:VapE domain-containing protein [Lacimicrobium alkaliphilum]|uniref:VapE domain-containing protein n=1 Tax=Lacimicrobium alkaliphilum TaxID=1526571 RepID=UPI0009EA5579|nr:VapE domain-containing protein [Lacimicrobium alkaliphilum]
MFNSINPIQNIHSWGSSTVRSCTKPDFPDFSTSCKGKTTLLNTAENLEAMIEHLGYRVQRNAMNLELEVTKNNEVIFTSFDALRSNLVGWCGRFGLPKIAIDDHLSAIAEENCVHPVAKWLEDGNWDGTNRVEKVISCLNAKNPGDAKVVLQHWLIGCVASLYEADFSSKLVPIIQGDQSFMKTTAIKRICSVVSGAFLEGAELNPDVKDSVLSVIKSWVVELGELERTSRNSQGSLKAFITRQIDTVRPPYARIDVQKPRQTHLIASVNGTNFLKDDSGNSRYVVIELKEAVDIKQLNYLLGWSYEQGRIQLQEPNKLKQFWLEVKHCYESGKSWNLTPDQVAQFALNNDKHADKGGWYEILLDRYVLVDDEACTKRLFKATDICDLEKIDKRFVRQVGQALTRLVAEGKIQSQKGRANATYYELKLSRSRDKNGFY